jgi:hypothetical protein
VFVFPGVGLGAIAAGPAITDGVLGAARAGDAVTDGGWRPGPLSAGRGLGPCRGDATVVVREAIDAGLAGIAPDSDVDAVVDAAMWWPDYVAYAPIRRTERRRVEET